MFYNQIWYTNSATSSLNTTWSIVVILQHSNHYFWMKKIICTRQRSYSFVTNACFVGGISESFATHIIAIPLVFKRMSLWPCLLLLYELSLCSKWIPLLIHTDFKFWDQHPASKQASDFLHTKATITDGIPETRTPATLLPSHRDSRQLTAEIYQFLIFEGNDPSSPLDCSSANS